MGTPITGPFTRDDYLLHPPPRETMRKYTYTRTWWRQKKPYDHRLPYSAVTAYVDTKGGNSYRDAQWIANAWCPYGPAVNVAKSRAWGRFEESVSINAEFGETIATMKSSGIMLTRRIEQMVEFVGHVNRYDFYRAYQALNLPKPSPKDRWAKDRSIASIILELQYGWRPLIKDIESAWAILCADPKLKRAIGRATVIMGQHVPAPGPYSAEYSHYHQTKVQYLCDIRMTNPNLALASALGLTNILGTAVALVPYSFVLDWFTNLSQALRGYNLFMGRLVINPATTVTSHLRYKETWSDYPGWLTTGWANRVERTSGLLIPPFFVKPLTGWSPERALNAISLLIQMLPVIGDNKPAWQPRKRQPPRYDWTDPSISRQPRRGG